MHSSTLFTTIVALAATIALGAPVKSGRSTGKAIVQNKCSFPLWVWSVGVQTTDAYKVDPGRSYSESFHPALNGGGISIKVSKTNQPIGIEQVEYSVSNTLPKTLYYDLSEIDGSPLAGQVVLRTGIPSCPVVDSRSAYHRPDDVATKSCDANTDLTLTVC